MNLLWYSESPGSYLVVTQYAAYLVEEAAAGLRLLSHHLSIMDGGDTVSVFILLRSLSGAVDSASDLNTLLLSEENVFEGDLCTVAGCFMGSAAGVGLRLCEFNLLPLPQNAGSVGVEHFQARPHRRLLFGRCSSPTRGTGS